MKQDRGRIKNMFSDFEPEASDASIEEGWENITYFLPGKEKRRPAFYLLSCAGIFCALLMTVAGAFILYNYKISETEIAQNKTKNAIPSPLAPVLDETKPAQTGSKAHVNIPGDQKTAPANSKNANEITRALNGREQATGSNNTDTPKPLSGRRETAAWHKNNNSEKNPAEESSDSHSVSVGDKATSENLRDNEQTMPNLAGNNNNTLTPAGKENISLPMYNLLLPPQGSDSVKEMPLVSLSVPASGVRGVFKLHVFGGTAYAITALHDKTYDLHKKTNAIHASVGIALSYQFINKVSVIGQFVYSKDQMDYKHTLTERIDLLSSQNVTSAPEKKYIEIYTESMLKSKQSYNAAIGVGYRFYQKGRLGLNGFLLLNLRAVNYQYKEIHTLGTKEILYQPGITIPPPAGSNILLPDLNDHKTITTAALVPGLMIDYKINKNYAVIIRPSYALQAPANNGRYKNLFLVKQNTLYLDLGIQLKW